MPSDDRGICSAEFMVPRSQLRATLVLPLLTSLLALSGCSTGSTTSPTLAPTPTPDTYPFTADVFTLKVPMSWQNKTEDPATVQKVVRTSEGTGVLVLIHDVPGQFVNGQ